MRRVIAALIVVGLAVGVVLLWPRAASDTPPETVAGPTTTLSVSTTTTTTSSTTTTGPTTTSDVVDDGSHVVETVEEAEEILRELWFGWFEGIYNQDEERIREVVVLEETVATARESFGIMEFTQPPQIQLIELSDSDVLRSDEECIAVWSELDISSFRPEASKTSGVHVIRRVKDGWALLSVWPQRDDLWEADCDSVL